MRDLTTPDLTAPGSRACGLFILLLALLSTPGAANAKRLHVDGRQRAAKGNGSTHKPYRSLAAAIAAAKSGDEIRVASGTYGSIVVSNKTLAVRGGYRGNTQAEYQGGQAGDFSQAARDRNPTRIQGAGKGYAVVFRSAGASQITGFYVSGGKGGISSEGWPPEKNQLLIQDNIVEKNHTKGEGGGISAGTNAVIHNNIIRQNRAAKGGGIAAHAPRIRIASNTIEDNVGTSDHGGGIYVSSKDVLITGNVIRRNSIGVGIGYGVGGGICVFESKARLQGNIVYRNKSPEHGSGVFIDDGSHATMLNDLVFDNACGFRGGAGIFVDGLDAKKKSYATIINVTVVNHRCKTKGNGLRVNSSVVEVKNSIFWDNGDDFDLDRDSSLKVSYTTSREAIAGPGNSRKDPLFASAAKRDYHLRSAAGRWDPRQKRWVEDARTSPAIDTGLAASDWKKEPMPNGGRINRGVYGNTKEASKSKAPTRGGIAQPKPSPPTTTAASQKPSARGGEKPATSRERTTAGPIPAKRRAQSRGCATSPHSHGAGALWPALLLLAVVIRGNRTQASRALICRG